MAKIFSHLKDILQGKLQIGASSKPDKERGFLVFQNTAEVIRAETLLMEAGFVVEVKGPPPEFHTGCDLVIVFDLMQEPLVRQVLQNAHLEFMHCVPLRNPLLEPVSLFQTQDYVRHFMVRAANMKMTVDRSNGRIVNISGGGCPDVPHLATILTGQLLNEALEPRVNGKTLCSYSLQRAFEEARRIWQRQHSQNTSQNSSDLATKTTLIPPKEKSAESLITLPDLPQEKFEVKRQNFVSSEWMICGTIPDSSFPLISGRYLFRQKQLFFEKQEGMSIHRGTPALLASAAIVCDFFGTRTPLAVIVGDNGMGEGSRQLYAHLEKILPNADVQGLTFHYLFPDIDGHNKVLMALESRPKKPLLVADAGFMYVAKMSGYASSYDLFTPDLGELAFLADEKAPHPFYTRGFLLDSGNSIPMLTNRAYQYGNAAKFLLIKGAVDFLVQENQIIGKVESPQIPAMEAIGGTGDLVVGIATGLLACGLEIPEACLVAAHTARIVGMLANPTPATQIAELLPFLPKALEKTLKKI